MARTIAEIQESIIAAKAAEPVLAPLTNASVTARWRLWTRVVASAIWALEIIFDNFKIDIITQVEKLKPHSVKWYQQKALDFQLGSDLIEGDIVYDNSALTADDIAMQKIVSKAAVTDGVNQLVVKVVKGETAALIPMTIAEKTAFEAYLNEVKDAGVQVAVISQTGDSLRLEMDIYFDPLILNQNGERLDGTNATPVQTSITNFLAAIDFNDLFVPTFLVDALQLVDGVEIPIIKSIEAASTNGGSYTNIEVQYRPDAGWMKIYDDTTDLTLNFIAQSV